MKRFFTLLFALGLLVAADAQPRQKGGKKPVKVKVVTTSTHYGRSDFATDRLIRQEIASINLKFDRKIQQVQHNFFMPRYQKARTIRRLKVKRQEEINFVYRKYAKNSHYKAPKGRKF